MLPPETPLWLVPILGLVTTFFYFMAAMLLKEALIKTLGRDNKLARVIFFVIGGRFLYQDVVANYVCFAPIAWHWPKRLGEDGTITSHANALINHYTQLAIERKKSDTVPYLYSNALDYLTGLERWRLTFSIFICTHLNKIEKGHCSALK